VLPNKFAVVLTALALAAVGCGGGGTTSEGPSLAPASASPMPSAALTVGEECLDEDEARGAISMRVHGVAVRGVVIGSGAAGVVLAHQSNGSVCEWWPYARELQAAGYRVLAIDFEGYGASDAPSGGGDPAYQDDVIAAATWLRSHGTPLVVLMGASLGGAAVIVAAAKMPPRPAGVIDLSGPRSFAGLEALQAAPDITAPILFAVGEQDAPFAADTRAIRKAARSATTTLVTVPGRDHGVSLVQQGPGWTNVRTAVRTFLRQVLRR
jgi:pimeloyl-ACP methyl ester carboxylesterase